MIKYSSIFLALLITTQPALATGLTTIHSHRAVYDVTLLEAQERSGIKQMDGRIVYEMKGNECEGYSVRFRFVADIQTGSDSFKTDQRTLTHESADGKEFYFNTSSFVNDIPDQKQSGNAIQNEKGISVSIKTNTQRQLDLESATFPITQLVDIINQAKKGESFVKHDVFDGSGDADQVLNNVSVIGRPKLITELFKGEDKEAAKPLLTQVAWPVTMSYFEKSNTRSSEATPIFETSFYLYENGVTRQLQLRYPNYTLSGNISNLEYLEQESCTLGE